MGTVLPGLAFPDQPAAVIGGLELHELVLGLVVFPLVPVAAVLLAGRHLSGPVRFSAPAGIAANLALIVVLVAVPFTAGAAALFYGAALLAAAVWGQLHCEAMLVSNLILRRADQLGCPSFTPLDGIDARRAR